MSIAEILHSAMAAETDTGLNKLAEPNVAPRFATLPSRIKPILSERQLQHLQAHPPASRQRHLKSAADKFVSSGASVFIHYAEPILQELRTAMLESGDSKKRYHKTAAQLWPDLRHDEQFFWNVVIARQLRQSFKQKHLSYEECVKYAGKVEDVPTCLYYAQLAVSRYLGLDAPDPPQPDLPATADPVTYAMAVVIDSVGQGSAADVLTRFGLPGLPQLRAQEEEEEQQEEEGAEEELPEISDPPFEYTRSMLYSHFAHYDLDGIRKAEGRTQTVLLRHLCERFDQTGKELFLYYMVPRLCKQAAPPKDAGAVLSLAHEIWAHLIEREKEVWRAANSLARQRLGSGELQGLVFLELGGRQDEVLGLHDMAERALGLHEEMEGVKVAEAWVGS